MRELIPESVKNSANSASLRGKKGVIREALVLLPTGSPPVEARFLLFISFKRSTSILSAFLFSRHYANSLIVNFIKVSNDSPGSNILRELNFSASAI